MLNKEVCERTYKAKRFKQHIKSILKSVWSTVFTFYVLEVKTYKSVGMRSSPTTPLG